MQTEIREGYVKSELHQGVATIEFYHPQSNALPGVILDELTHAIHGAGNDERAKVVVLRSAGEKAFCAGASFDELKAIKNEEEGHRFFSGFANVINAMRLCPKFIIGRIHGKCAGGGVGLAAAVDYAIAVESVEVWLSELSIGIGPFVVGPAIERKIGLSSFSQLAIDAGMWRSGDWARRKGLFAELHPTIHEMDESVFRLTGSLVQSNPGAMSAMKKTLWAGTENWDQLLVERAAISGKLVLSDHTKNAIEKFKGSR